MREVEAICDTWSGPRLVRVANAASFASKPAPLERSVFDARGLDPALHHLLTLPWAGVVVPIGAVPPPSGVPTLQLAPTADVRAGDVLDMQRGRKRIPVVYRPGDRGNVLFTTERCNNFCLMCSQPPRDIDDAWRVEHLLHLIELIDADEASLGISGGEPTLLGEGLARIIARCAQTLPQTQLHVLTNGRRFSEPDFAKQFEDLHSRLTWAVPLYGDTYRLHDFVVQGQGAFAETMRGLYALHEAGQRIEIRVVLVRPVVERLPAIARFIQRNLPFAHHIALMGTEPIGFAKAHHGSLWMDPADMGPSLQTAADELTTHGLAVSLYNLPLCALPQPLWRYAQRAISDWKQDYLPACEGCAVRSRCGGFFQWITPQWTSRAIAPVSQGESYA
ncbi:His-Xaa-Ser system radical SAM maturase HxsC [Cognatilysobacter terrigena]|uniref:His-Xaa-Ser system radical SAM maturase HxsC n=1 Tax=Cognatilysobacter terrigena TaxID=2488749 RepID=UPI00105F755F|nr:His-Xaa-Ser system radical SAM maturase HxsC [Lysobacter terrigena]